MANSGLFSGFFRERLRMKMLHRLVLVVCLLCLAGLAEQASAQDRPIALSEARRMLDRGESRDEVIQAMAQRGVSFQMNANTQRRLNDWGFTDQQIALITRIAAGEAVDPGADPQADAPADEGEGPAPAAFDVGYPNPAHWHASEQRRIVRAVQNAGLGYDRIELSRCTLYCTAARARQLAPMLRELEAALIARFPDSISNACDPRSAHIVIVDGESQWRNWVQSSFASYEQDRIRFSFGPDADNPGEQFARFSSYYLPDLAAMHADRAPDDERIARFAAYALGHLMMGQAAGPEQPDGLQTGFGDLAETMAFQTPSIMVFSYEERDLAQEQDWRAVVAQLFEARDITNTTRPWGYETSTMQPPNYAECWSLVSTLAEAPEQFAEAVGLVRNGEAEMAQAVTQVYRLDERRLMMAWHQFVSR